MAQMAKTFTLTRLYDVDDCEPVQASTFAAIIETAREDWENELPFAVTEISFEIPTVRRCTGAKPSGLTFAPAWPVISEVRDVTGNVIEALDAEREAAREDDDMPSTESQMRRDHGLLHREYGFL
jgi:hypothetical protein